MSIESRFSSENILRAVPSGDLRAVSRLISLVENGVPRARGIVSELHKKTGHAHVIGITGSPGAGKSTLVDQLANEWIKRGKKVAILAIDPSSPFSGGAVLGDRIRMNHASAEPSVLIRSMATRGALGGLSRSTNDTINVLDAAGFDIILIETVGVGQAEVDIVQTADTCVVVLVPGMGDSVQAFKAGILEIADLFVINKSDREGADILEKDLLTLLSLVDQKPGEWRAPILRTVATEGTGCVETVTKLAEHIEWLKTSKQGELRRKKNISASIIRLIRDAAVERAVGRDDSQLAALVERSFKKEIDPYSAAEKLLAGK